jgi:NAD(P)-dependent dehydrogenase (short-subunit alcohol dehydrogenase family)
VVIADVDQVEAEATVDMVRAVGGSALSVVCDVSNLDDVEALARAAEQWFGGPVELVVNNAGIGTGGQLIGETCLSDWERTIAVNLWGVVHGCQVFVPRMRAAGGGGLINIASAASFGSAPRMAAYNVSKAGVLALSETLAAELSGSGVTVSVVCPTFVKTNIIQADAIDEAMLPLATGAMARFGWDPRRLARVCLEAHDQGRLHVLPQLDARLMWTAKRLAPAVFTRAVGMLGRRLAVSGPSEAGRLTPSRAAHEPTAVVADPPQTAMTR